MKQARRYNVYVIALNKDVLNIKKFRERNPGYVEGKPCVYVGMTSSYPKERFEQHKAGYKASKYPHKFGLYLRPKLYAKYNPMSYEEAKIMEGKLARDLQKKGYAVWWN
jgi:hypothetical protein